tara:strand:+ start:1314 stop:1442 length:129 start_codon:yes stop_codon:yes gene_type:complete
MSVEQTYRVSIMLDAARRALREHPTIEAVRECRDLRRQLREA